MARLARLGAFTRPAGAAFDSHRTWLMSQDVLDTGFIHPDEMKEIGDTNYPALGSNGNERQWIGVARYQVARGFCTFEVRL